MKGYTERFTMSVEVTVNGRLPRTLLKKFVQACTLNGLTKLNDLSRDERDNLTKYIKTIKVTN